MELDHTGLAPLIGFLIGAVGAQVIREYWTRTEKAINGLTRTQCLALIVGCLGVFHVFASFKPDLAKLEPGMFWTTVMIVVLFIIDPWIDPWLRRKGIRKSQ